MVAYADAIPNYPPSETGTDKSLINAMDSLAVTQPSSPNTKKLEYPFAAGDPDAGGFDLLVKSRNAPVFVPRAQRPATQHHYHMQQQQAYANNRVQSRSVSASKHAPAQSQPSSRDGDVESASASSASQPATLTQVATAQTSATPKPPTPQQQPRPGYVSPVPQHDKLTAAQLEEKMVRMRQLNASMVAKRLAQETDAKAYEDGIVAERQAQQDEQRRLAKANRQVENARRDAAARKLANMQGRAWDADKDKESMPSPAQPKDEPIPAPASTELASEPGAQKVFERAPAPHLPPPRFNSGQTIYYAPGPVPAVDVVARSDLIGWGTPPDTPPARADGTQPAALPPNAVTDQQNAPVSNSWTQPAVDFQPGHQQHLISTAPPPSWPSRSVPQESSVNPGRNESDKPALPPGFGHAAKSEAHQAENSGQPAGLAERSALQDQYHAYPPPQGQQQPQQYNQSQGQGWQKSPASVEQLPLNSTSQATTALDDGGWGPAPAQFNQRPPSSATATGSDQYGAFDRSNAVTVPEAGSAGAAQSRDSGGGFQNAVSSPATTADDGGWGVFDPLASVKAGAAVTSEQDSFMKPPPSNRPPQTQASAQMNNRGIESSKWAPKGVQSQPFPTPVVPRPDVNASWRAAFRPAPVPEEDISWEVVDKSSSGPQSTSADQPPQAAQNSQQQSSSSSSGWHNDAPDDGGWGSAAPTIAPAHPQQHASASWMPASERSAPAAPSSGGWNDSSNAWGQPSHPHNAPAFSQAGHQHSAQAPVGSAAAAAPASSGDWGTPLQATQAGPSGWGQQPSAANAPSWNPTVSNTSGQMQSTAGAEQGWGASNAPQQQPQARSGWGAPFQGHPVPPSPPPQGHHQPQQVQATYQQQVQQPSQPPASEPQPAQPRSTSVRAPYVHPDRLNAVPQAASIAAPSPPAQEFGFAGKGFGFGGGKNLRLDRDDSAFARYPSGGFNGGQQSFGGETNAGGGANAVPLGGRPRWGGLNGGASPASANNDRPAYSQPQSTSAANGWGGSYASGPANGGTVQTVDSSW